MILLSGIYWIDSTAAKNCASIRDIMAGRTVANAQGLYFSPLRLSCGSLGAALPRLARFPSLFYTDVRGRPCCALRLQIIHECHIFLGRVTYFMISPYRYVSAMLLYIDGLNGNTRYCYLKTAHHD